MSRSVAVLCDIHGNWPALEAVLAEIEREEPEQIIIGGDVVAGPMPRECWEALHALPIPVQFVRGNADREVLSAMKEESTDHLPPELATMCAWVTDQLDPGAALEIEGWPLTVRQPVSGIGEVLICHATPRDDNEIFTKLTPVERLLPIFASLNVDLVVCGHTHMAFDRHVGKVRVVNAGSVGMPYDRPGASWVQLGPTVAFQRTDFDREAAARTLRNSGYPGADAFIASYIHDTPAEELALSIFEPRALGDTPPSD